MACVGADGSLTASARAILAATRRGGTAESIAATTGLPLYRVRGALRELLAANLIEPFEGGHRLTPAGETRLRA